MAALQCSLEDCSKFLKSVLPMKLHQLQDIAAHVASGNCSHPPLLKDFIFDQFPVPGTTPLLLACQQGELDSVKHIVESWGVDVRASAMFYVDPYHRSSVRLTTPPIVTPLFAAASHGHGNIVRYLLEKGANVSDKISLKNDKDSGLTPLYGAVRQYHPFSFKSLLEQQKERSAVVRSLLEFGADLIADSFRPFDGQPMWKERMCGVDAITVLIDHGLDLKQRNPATGGTLLHHWVDYPTFIYFYDHSRTHYVLEEDSLSIVKLLVEKGADLLARDHEGFTALLKAADQFNLKVLDYLIEREEYGRMEKIEALELVGAAILFDSGNDSLFPKAFEYWRRAHQLRQMEIKVSGSSSKKILGRKIGNNLEWTTLADLDQLEQHPRDYEIQALLVKLRILSSCIGVAHRDSSIGYIFYLSRSACLDNEEKFTQILDIIWGRFDVMIRRLNSLPTDSTFLTLVENDVEELVSTLSALEANHPNLNQL